MDYGNLVPVIGTIINISGENDCCSRMITLRTESGIVNFRIVSDTRIIDDRQLRVGFRVAAFYDGNLPVPLIFPPQYTAQIVTLLGRNEQIMLNFFDRNLTAADRSLQLNIGRGTNISTINGQSVNCNPANRMLLVYYTATTRSIPPQTSPSRVIVLC